MNLTPNPSSHFLQVQGDFYRAVSAQAVNHVLNGSTQPGRYSSKAQKTLYLSISPEGVSAAMQAHTKIDSPAKTIVKLSVTANDIFDLRDNAACRSVGINPADANAPWQEIVQNNGMPRSWTVSETLRKIGANGLVDPSRNAPGLWHLVLFNWNNSNGPVVALAD